MLRAFLVIVTLALAGCASPAEPAPEQGDEPDGATAATGPSTVGNTTIDVADNGTVHVAGALAAGEGLWVTFPFSTAVDRVSYSYQLRIESGAGCGGRFAFLAPSIMGFEEDGAHHYSFEPRFSLGTASRSGFGAAASSASHFVALTTALVAETDVCYELDLEADAAFLVAPNVTAMRSTWSTHGPYTANEGNFDVPIKRTGWTHAHRSPGCTMPAEDVAPSELIMADLTFPNDIRLRAGPYMNGIFPGPTVDDASFFGVFHDEPGNLVAQVTAPTPECLVVIDTDLELEWLEPSASYVDRWWRQEPILPP